MNIIIDGTPLKDNNQYRGVGLYTKYLLRYLKKAESRYTYHIVYKVSKEYKNGDIYHYPYFDIFKRTLKVNKKYKTVVTIHDLIPLRFPQHFPSGIKGKINWLAQRHSLKQVDAVITDSMQSKLDIIKLAHVPEKKVHVVYLAAGEEFKRLNSSEMLTLNLHSKYNLPRRFILYVGDVNWNKNIKGLVKAFKMFQTKNGVSVKDIKLVFVGKAFVEKSIKETNEIDVLIKDLHIENDIVKVGFVPKDDLIGIYNSALAYIQPSWYEGFGLPILEAMSCGVPVASSNTGSLPEVGGDAVLYFNPNNENEMINSIVTICLDKNKRFGLINRGEKQAKKFTWEKTTRETLNVFTKLIEVN